jgi:D-threonate/D-erythronate kinase
VLLLAAADDRTGALETAGALADAGAGPVHVHAWAITAHHDLSASEMAVVDLGTRHADEARAVALAVAVDAVPARRHAHKVDSTLRGNWAAELVARGGRPVLLVPALPALGRTCRDGTVRVDGVPVHETASADDIGRRLDTSRPGDLLTRAGAPIVHALDGADATSRWLEHPHGVAVCDASTDADVTEVVAVWAMAPDEVLLAGTAAVIGAAAGALLEHRAAAPEPPSLRSPVLVVCGSTHPVARAQIERLRAAGAVVVGEVDDAAVERLALGEPVVLCTPKPDVPVTSEDAHATALRVAAQVTVVTANVELGTLVLLGGDTAAAVLGARTVEVGGTMAAGVPWGRAVGGGPLVVTRAGGFGTDDALVDLLSATLMR